MCVGNEICRSRIPENRGKILFEIPVNKISSVELTRNKQQDSLALLTYYTKELLVKFAEVSASLQSWKYYRMIRGKTQPAHLLAIVSVLSVARILQSEDESTYSPGYLGILKLVYLGSFAVHLGAQIWMTFVSGLSLYFTLPRHTFGSVQKVLFPKYFSLNASLSFLTLCAFVQCQTDSENNLQVIFLVCCFLTELMIRLYLTPPLVQLMIAKNAIEKEAGVGTEVGEFQPGCLAHCPHYMGLHSSFRRVHMTIAIGNMLTMACTFSHLYYLSLRICI